MDPIARMYAERDEAALDNIRNYRKPSVRLRASELADCKRAVYYRLTGHVPSPDTGFSNDWSEEGDIHHDIVRHKLLAHGFELAGVTVNDDGTMTENKYVVQEFEYEGKPFKISTRQDGWIKHPDHGWMLLEIKSVGHWPYKYMNDAYQAGGHDGLLEYIMEKKPNFIYQVHAGMAIAKARGPEALPFDHTEKHTLDLAYIIIKDRSNCHIGFHDGERGVSGGVYVPWEDETWEKIGARSSFTTEKVRDGKIPMAEYTSSSTPCGYCRYRYLCHDADRRRKAGLEPAIQYPHPAVSIEFNEPTED
jgi:CRISPR/Cas system-associated exonuclease Cas4 (RecB family)